MENGLISQKESNSFRNRVFYEILLYIAIFITVYAIINKRWLGVLNLNIAICDDDKNIRDKVQNYLMEYFMHEKFKINFHQFDDGFFLIDSSIRFDIIILDIEMKIYDGFKVRDELFHERINSRIIYLTNYKDQLINAIGKNVYGFVSKDNMDGMRRFLNIIINEYKDHQLIKIAGKNIDLFHIVYIEADGAYCQFFLANGDTFIERIYLNKVEEQLNKHIAFCRIHRSYIVNFKYVQKCSYNAVELKQTQHLETELRVSANCSKDVKKKYLNYIKEKCRNG